MKVKKHKLKNGSELLKIAFTTGYTDEQYKQAIRQFFSQKEVYEKALAEGPDFIEYEDSIFYFKKESKNGNSKR